MDRVVIIGLGLIGGSLGMALKAAKLWGIEIVGVDNSWDVVNQAKKKSAVDATERSAAIAVKSAQLVIVATPLMAFPEIFQEIAPYLQEGSVVTDTGSTKARVMQWAQELLPPTVHFVGGHPMAGREVSGIWEASATLFQKATYCIMPAPSAANAAVELIAGLATTVGATPYFVDPEEHDMLVAGISHLPLLASAALVNTTAASPSWDEMAKLASTGFRDASRLASTDPELSRGIGLTNQPGLLHWLDGYLKVLLEYRRALVEDPDRLLAELSRAHEARLKWLAGLQQRGGPQSVQELPSAGEQMAELFVGSRLAQAMREQQEKWREADPGPGRERKDPRTPP